MLAADRDVVLRLPAAGDPAHVSVLRAAAREAAARGAADAAITYLRRALDEPPAENERGHVLHELGLAEAADRRRDEFEAHLRAAIALTGDPVARSQIALDLGRAVASCGEFRGSVEIFHQALGGVPDREDELGVALEAEMLAMAFHEFTCTALVAPHWERRFAELEAGAPLAARTLAHLHLAVGQPDTALREARAAGRLVSATIANPYCCDWRSAAALALAALRRRDAARALAEVELADARRFGVPEAEGASLRTLGLVLGGADGLQALRDSVAVVEHAEGRLEHARSLLELGAALRRAGIRTEARDVLRAALDETARIGASGLADRAHDELVAAGARPRRDRRLLSGRESLTASEDRTAALAAYGLTNREIAQRQFVTVKTWGAPGQPCTERRPHG